MGSWWPGSPRSDRPRLNIDYPPVLDQYVQVVGNVSQHGDVLKRVRGQHQHVGVRPRRHDAELALPLQQPGR